MMQIIQTPILTLQQEKEKYYLHSLLAYAKQTITYMLLTQMHSCIPYK